MKAWHIEMVATYESKARWPVVNHVGRCLIAVPVRANLTPFLSGSNLLSVYYKKQLIKGDKLVKYSEAFLSPCQVSIYLVNDGDGVSTDCFLFCVCLSA